MSKNQKDKKKHGLIGKQGNATKGRENWVPITFRGSPELKAKIVEISGGKSGDWMREAVEERLKNLQS